MRVSAQYISIKKIATQIIFLCCYNNMYAQVYGCSDPAAENYNASVTINDGSCMYKNVSITPTLNANLSTTVNETSGLIWFNKQVWTHNDSGGEPVLYSIDNATGDTVKTVIISNATNKDWEDIAQDDKYIYIGDFGNNTNGNRTDLKIYRVKKSDVKKKTTVTATVINYAYDDQTDFTATGSNHTDFDCEALIAYGDSLFLFSKDWVDNKARLYKLPKLPGTYTATKIGELNVEGLITGAEIVADKRVIVLTGYNAVVEPFVYLLYDFTDNHFFDANTRKIVLNQSLTQVEGICSVNEKKFYISNERLQKIFTVPAKLQTINLGSFLNPYYNHLPAKKNETPFITGKKSLQNNHTSALQ